MKCSNSAFKTQSSKVTIVGVHEGGGGAAVKTYVAAVEALRKKGKDRMKLQFSSPPKIGGKTSLSPIYISFCKYFSSPNSYAFDALLCRNWPFLDP
jgi:hypothetical protein